MKFKNIIPILCGAATLFCSCEEKSGRTTFPYSAPEISGLVFSVDSEITATDTLFFSLEISDPLTPLSTLEVSLQQGEKQLYSESIRTKNQRVQIDRHAIYIPFGAEMESGEATLMLTAINVEGSETQTVKKITVKRPEIPNVIYLHYNENVIELTQSSEKPYEYVSASGEFPEKFNGKVSTGRSLTDSKLIWGYSETTNSCNLIEADGSGFAFNYTDWKIEKFVFNVFSFKVDIVGESKFVFLNNTTLKPQEDGYFFANVRFEQGQEVDAAGFDDLEGAYNRDFFEYDEETGKLTFLRESGYWEVYYSSKYNYMWIARMSDVAPEGYWLIGHGFTSAPRWHADYANYASWEMSDIGHMGYIVRVSENIYQITVYLTTDHAWGGFEVEMFSERKWADAGGKDLGMMLKASALSGDTNGFAISASDGITSGEGFAAGYYRLTFDTSAGVGKEKLHIKRL